MPLLYYGRIIPSLPATCLSLNAIVGAGPENMLHLELTFILFAQKYIWNLGSLPPPEDGELPVCSTLHGVLLTLLGTQNFVAQNVLAGRR